MYFAMPGRHSLPESSARQALEQAVGWMVGTRAFASAGKPHCDKRGFASSNPGAYSRFSTWSTRRRAQLEERNVRLRSSGS